MTDRFELSMPQFAVWARRGRVRLPYPLEISEVPGYGVQVPDDDLLTDLGHVLAAPRISAFALHSHPDGRTDCFVAVARGDRGILVRTSGTIATLEAVADTDLAKRVVEALPQPDGARERAGWLERLGDEPVAVPDDEWSALFAQLAQGGATDVVLHRFAEWGLPAGLATAMADAAQDPVAVGVLGAAAWSGATEQLGPHMSAWFEYPGAAVITEREPARGRRPALTWIHRFGPDAALRVLAVAVGAAGSAAGPGDESSLGGLPLTLGDEDTQAGARVHDLR